MTRPATTYISSVFDLHPHRRVCARPPRFLPTAARCICTRKDGKSHGEAPSPSHGRAALPEVTARTPPSPIYPYFRIRTAPSGTNTRSSAAAAPALRRRVPVGVRRYGATPKLAERHRDSAVRSACAAQRRRGGGRRSRTAARSCRPSVRPSVRSSSPTTPARPPGVGPGRCEAFGAGDEPSSPRSYDLFVAVRITHRLRGPPGGPDPLPHRPPPLSPARARQCRRHKASRERDVTARTSLPPPPPAPEPAPARAPFHLPPALLSHVTPRRAALPLAAPAA